METEKDATIEKRIEKEIALLRNGHIPKKYNEKELIDEQLKKGNYTTTPLTFEEITSYNTFFAMYPHRIAGIEEIKSSRNFPLQIKGTKQQIIATIDQIITSDSELELEAEALALELQLLEFNSMNGIYHNNTELNGLGKLGKNENELIEANQETALEILEKSKNEKEHKPTDKLSFDKIVSSYNKGITKEEIQAWVWYKRSMGIPMYGWEKYFLPTKGKVEIGKNIVAIRDTIVKDIHFRDIVSVEKGKVLGKPTSKTLHGSIEYVIYRDAEGLKYANKADVKEENMDLKTDPKALGMLVMNGALFYRNGELLPAPIYGFGNMYDRTLELQKDREHIIRVYGEKNIQ